MNIIQQQRYLENLSDPELTTLGTQGGNEEIDSYPITLEMSRRSKVRADDEARRAQHEAANPPTVDDKVKQEFAGITGADPSMDAGMPPDQMEMADLQRGIATQEMGPQSPMGPQPPMMAASGGLIPGYYHGGSHPTEEEIEEAGRGFGGDSGLTAVERLYAAVPGAREEAESLLRGESEAHREWIRGRGDLDPVELGDYRGRQEPVPRRTGPHDVGPEQARRRNREALAAQNRQIRFAERIRDAESDEEVSWLVQRRDAGADPDEVPQFDPVAHALQAGFDVPTEEERAAQQAEEGRASLVERLSGFELLPATTGSGVRRTSWSGVPSGNIEEGRELIQGTRDLLTTRTAEDIAAEKHREASALATRLGHEELYGTRMERLAELDEQMLTGEEIDSLRTARLFGDLSSLVLDTSRDPDKYKNVITGITTRDKTIREDIATQTKEIADLLDKGMIDYNTAQEAYRNVETKRLQDIANLPRTEAINLMKSEIDLLKERHRGAVDLESARIDYEAALGAAEIQAENYRHDPAMQEVIENLVNDARLYAPGDRFAKEGSPERTAYDNYQTRLRKIMERYYMGPSGIIPTAVEGRFGLPIATAKWTEGRGGVSGGAGFEEQLSVYVNELGQLSDQELVRRLMEDASELDEMQLRRTLTELPEERRNMVLAEFAKEQPE